MGCFVLNYNNRREPACQPSKKPERGVTIMSAGKANCLVCGEPIVYHEQARELTCQICGKTELGHCACAAGHYVCDACHRSEGVRESCDFLAAATSKNPVELAAPMMDKDVIYPNGPEHHTLIGASLLVAFANAGGNIDKEQGLAELRKRSLNVPGGTCGFWGACGAAVSAGQFWSIVSGSSPIATDTWGQCQKLTSNILGKLAELGGPRCCKRTGFIAIQESVAFARETTGIEMELPETIICHWFARNAECLRTRCPFFPQNATHPGDK